jgi:hypothetical protein
LKRKKKFLKKLPKNFLAKIYERFLKNAIQENILKREIFLKKKLKISLQILMKDELIHQPKKKIFKEREFKKNYAKYLCNEKND